MTERPRRADASAGPIAESVSGSEVRRSGPPKAILPDELAAWTRGRLLLSGTRSIAGGAVDSRLVRPGEIFFAFPGERTDGHRFLESATAAGAGALIVTEELPADRIAAIGSAATDATQPTIVRVADPGDALRSVGGAWREAFHPLVVGVTGSLAKTSTKEQVAEVLATRRVVLRSEGNLNNEIGLPLTLLRLRVEHEAVVLEMGFYVPGEIALLAGLARPSIGVVTAVRGVHLSRAGTLDAIEAGKRELVEALPADGWAILNADDARVARMGTRSAARVLTYGFAADADVGAADVRSAGAEGMRFELRADGQRRDVATPALGRHGVHNALAAAAVGIAAGLPLDDVVRGLARPAGAPHRSQLIRSGALTILDDSYNASPDAVIAALDLLGELPGRRVAVLGEMLELGDASEAEHVRVGRHAATVVGALVVVGHGASGIVDGALAAGLEPRAVRVVVDREQAATDLATILRAGDVVLVKASRGAALDLLLEPLRALGRDLAAGR